MPSFPVPTAGAFGSSSAPLPPIPPSLRELAIHGEKKEEEKRKRFDPGLARGGLIGAAGIDRYIILKNKTFGFRII